MERKWWHGKTAYQIYPKSFCDSNGDGIGDLGGIISKLDYLKELGVDIIWLSPIYCSPMADQGYDISDYYNIDPQFGTMEDMDRLLSEAKKRNMYIVMDLVANHCSDEHEWFKKACADPEGPYGKYFFIEPWHEGEPLPCNWRSYFGGSCWEKLPGHDDKVYLHLFHKKQPDLNWENPALRRELYDMINWWLDKGLAGFRIDAIINIKKLLPFRDLPADRADGLCSPQYMLDEAEGIEEFLDELARETFRKHDAFTVGEVFNPKPEHFPLMLGPKGCFSSMFDFSTAFLNGSDKGWYDAGDVTPDQFKETCFASQKLVEGIGFYSNIIENHDEPRGASRYIPAGEQSETSKKLLAGLYFLLPGLPFIYQGQEIGMEDMPFTDISQVDDVNTIAEYQVALDAGLEPKEALRLVCRLSRDNCRTPFQWDSSAHAGFTTGGKPWLEVNPNYTRINLEQQRGREDSLYAFYRALSALRKDPEYQESLVYGELVPYLPKQKRLMAYLRKGDKALLVCGNFQTEPQDMVLPGKVKAVILNNLPDYSAEEGLVHLRGYQFLVLELA